MIQTLTLEEAGTINEGDTLVFTAREAFFISMFRPEPEEASERLAASLVLEYLKVGLVTIVERTEVVILEDFITDDYLHTIRVKVLELTDPAPREPQLAGAPVIIALAITAAIVVATGFVTDDLVEVVREVRQTLEGSSTTINLALVVVALLALVYFLPKPIRAPSIQ